MSNLALPVAALAFCAWCVYLGGLASLQAQCIDAPSEMGTASTAQVYGFTPGLSCMRIYSFWWFVMSIEFVVVLGITLAAVAGKLESARMSFLGLFAVTTLLYMEASNAFLSLLNSVDYYSSDTQQNRLRTTVAGAIMTATFNGIMVVILGMAAEVPSNVPTTTVEKAAATAV